MFCRCHVGEFLGYSLLDLTTLLNHVDTNAFLRSQLRETEKLGIGSSVLSYFPSVAVNQPNRLVCIQYCIYPLGNKHSELEITMLSM